MKLDTFLLQFVEGYLFHDLESMEKIQLPPGQHDGAAGYPMLISALAGMELLGYLLMTDEDDFDNYGGDKYFLNYWNNFFVPEEQGYEGLGEIFRNLVRHALAHTALTKHGIIVTKGTGKKISINASARELYVDASYFCHDFINSYNRFVRPIVEGIVTEATTTADRMQRKLNTMEIAYETKSKNLFDALPQKGVRFNDITPFMSADGSYYPPAMYSASVSFSGMFASSALPPVSDIRSSRTFLETLSPSLKKKKKKKKK